MMSFEMLRTPTQCFHESEEKIDAEDQIPVASPPIKGNAENNLKNYENKCAIPVGTDFGDIVPC